MTEAAFVEQNSAVWKAMEDSLRHKPSGFQEIEERMERYRAISGHLSYARTYYPQSSICAYLDKLTADAHGAVYGGTEKRSVRAFFSKTLPKSLRDNFPFIAVATGIFLLAAIISFAVTMARPEYRSVFLPAEYVDFDPSGMIQGEGSGIGGWDGAIMSNYIMVNNIKVSILAFGLGLTCGIGTAIVLVTNGFMLGGLAAVYAQHRGSLIFWSLILPHGITELAAIFIAGGAGLCIGYSLIRPGEYKRGDSLIIAGREALKLLGAIIIMLIAAAFIEGFVTPLDIPIWIKYLFSAITLIPLIIYPRLGRERNIIPSGTSSLHRGSGVPSV